jgi:TDG/mug DNA glycosylase family protein
LLQAAEQRELLPLGFGVTNLVNRATATADEIAPAEFVAGRRRLAAKVRRYRPRIIAFAGIGAFAHAFGLHKVSVGEQPETFAGARVWVLPNPSGLNANYQLPQLVALFRALRQAADDAAHPSTQPAARNTSRA